MSIEHCPHLSGYDPLAPDVIVDPYPEYARARREAPVFFEPKLGWWFVTRYDDVLAVLKDPTRFGSSAALETGPVPPEVADRLPDGFPWSHPSLINNDPPGHARVRKLCNRAFRPTVIAAREAELVSIADALIDGFAADGRADLMSRFAQRFPILVIVRMLGAPEQDVDQFLEWSHDMITLMSPATEESVRVEASHRAADFYEYCDALIDSRRADGRDDLLTQLVEATVEDEPALTQAELISVLTQLIVGGHETANYMIGNVMLRLLERPELLAEVRADPSLVANAVEESLRQMGPVRGLFRVALEDVELGDAKISKGNLVAIHYASANHDPEHFANAGEFDIHRADIGAHLGLGKGMHFCLGAPLARLEGRVAVERLLTRLQGLHRPENGRVDYAPTPIHHGLTRLDIAWDA
jgi:cytochrome P450